MAASTKTEPQRDAGLQELALSAYTAVICSKYPHKARELWDLAGYHDYRALKVWRQGVAAL